MGTNVKDWLAQQEAQAFIWTELCKRCYYLLGLYLNQTPGSHVSFPLCLVMSCQEAKSLPILLSLFNVGRYLSPALWEQRYLSREVHSKAWVPFLLCPILILASDILNFTFINHLNLISLGPHLLDLTFSIKF